jgi:hypothetical protein
MVMHDDDYDADDEEVTCAYVCMQFYSLLKDFQHIYTLWHTYCRTEPSYLAISSHIIELRNTTQHNHIK